MAQTTKADINKLEQKIDSVKTELRTEIHSVGITLQGHIDRIENKMDTKMATKDDINRIMNAIDVFAGEAKDYRRKDADRGHMLMEQHDKLQNHENRISAIEARK
ncbi:MAG: hypothetical protein L6420_12185 [Elusimicrobia bacterium]|nr:hypothetical protein [Elusimicrobiota bacterium]